MPSSETGPAAGLSGNERLLVAIGVGAVLVVVLAVVLGFGSLFGVLAALLYFGVMLAIAGFVLWLLYRFVVAAERIADAQQRIARQQERPSTSERE